MRRALTTVSLTVLMGLTATPAVFAQQSLNLYLGGFVPRPEDARSKSGRLTDDVLVNDLDSLAFRLSDFTGATIVDNSGVTAAHRMLRQLLPARRKRGDKPDRTAQFQRNKNRAKIGADGGLVFSLMSGNTHRRLQK